MSDKSNPTQAEFSQCSRFDNFEIFLDNERSSDITFHVEGKQLYAHKLILAARSAFFAAMFEHSPPGKATGVVEIDDISYRGLKELFRFLYGGRVINIDELAPDLLVAANKFCLDGLKTLCETTMIYNLTVYNVCEWIVLAAAYNAASLKAASVDFILDHADQIIQTGQFRRFEKSHPIWASNLFRAVRRKRVKYDVAPGESFPMDSAVWA